MQYKDFIDSFKQLQIAQIKTISLPESCAPDQIPNVFQLLFANLIDILLANIDHFCQKSQIMAIFGLQVSAHTIQSTLPYRLNRIYHAKQPNFHFCCTLSYLKVFDYQLESTNSWQNSDSLVIDFTSGKVMDKKHYLFLMFNQGKSGKIFGQLSDHLLDTVWSSINQNFLITQE